MKEEMVIDGYLRYRNTPNEEWVAYSQTELLRKYLELKDELDAYKAKDEDLKFLKKTSRARGEVKDGTFVIKREELK